ncbi:tRNA uridine-5-carboxymethylaminomethyl(34) synthesis GTPase MnmE, partial [Elstera sp.]|uniref:tRNA uridine-5-carboxymethylaminomethyl(34) synthesis GTPase MnmE n=1 Tax=Elstera sp. TaxID=1916664 RepID=UPI0037C0FBC1
MAETIIAVATAPGRAGVAVLRASGPQAGALAEALTRKPLPPAREAKLTGFYDPADGALLDRGLLLWFPAPGSFTGEDVAEFQVHGSRAVLAALLTAACSVPGVRLAEPGEFTRRAFDHGKLDLTEVEGLADLIDAETEAQRRQAVRQLDGALGALVTGWQARLMRALAHCEATIDFVEEEDVPADLLAATRPDLAALLGEMQTHLADGRGERLRQGLTIVILGPPNAGKSSLLNALAGREAAIVSDRAGTTRDVIELHLDLGGYPVTLVDTAGLRETNDPIEAEGIRRARARADQADLALVLLDRADWPRVPDELTPWLTRAET